MKEKFFSSDFHFGHNNILSFKKKDGSPLRNFINIEEHDSFMIEQNNSVVGDDDELYHLGDAAIDHKKLANFKLLNGSVKLVRGNHDIARIKYYLMNNIKQIHGAKVFTPKDTLSKLRVIATHYPIYPDCIGKNTLNVHGHLHYQKVLLPNGEIDPRYLCVSMEQLDNYKPISMSEIVKIAKDRGII